MPFIINVMSNSIMIAAEAATANPCCGLVVQLKICIGNTENVSKSECGTKGT
jgi:hypothetical protein